MYGWLNHVSSTFYINNYTYLSNFHSNPPYALLFFRVCWSCWQLNYTGHSVTFHGLRLPAVTVAPDETTATVPRHFDLSLKESRNRNRFLCIQTQPVSKSNSHDGVAVSKKLHKNHSRREESCPVS